MPRVSNTVSEQRSIGYARSQGPSVRGEQQERATSSQGASSRQASVRLGCASDRLPRSNGGGLAQLSPLSRVSPGPVIYSCPNNAGPPSLSFNRFSFWLRLRLRLLGVARDASTVVKRVFGGPVTDRTARHVIGHGSLLPFWMVSCKYRYRLRTSLSIGAPTYLFQNLPLPGRL